MFAYTCIYNVSRSNIPIRGLKLRRVHMRNTSGKKLDIVFAFFFRFSLSRPWAFYEYTNDPLPIVSRGPLDVVDFLSRRAFSFVLAPSWATWLPIQRENRWLYAMKSSLLVFLLRHLRAVVYGALEIHALISNDVRYSKGLALAV